MESARVSIFVIYIELTFYSKKLASFRKNKKSLSLSGEFGP